MPDLNNTFNLPKPGDPRFQFDVSMAFARIRDSLGANSIPSFASAEFPSLTATRLLALDADQKLTNTNLISWVTGTVNRITAADDGDGTITLSGPQDIHTGASPTFAGLTTTGTVDIRATAGLTMRTDGSATNRWSLLPLIGSLSDGLTSCVISYANATAGSWPFEHFGALVFQGRSDALNRGGFAFAPNTAANGIALAIMEDKKVGIGTIAPNELLEVAGKIRANTAFNLNGTDVITSSVATFAGLTVDTDTLYVDSTNHRVGVGTAVPSLKFDVKGTPNTTFTNCPLLMQVHTTSAYADNMGGGISLGGMYDDTHSTTFGYIAGLKDGAGDGDTAGKLILGARATGGGAPDMAVVTIYGTGITTTKNIYPVTDDTYYLGKNDDDTPFAWKGLILKDQGGTGKYYRLEIVDNTLVITDLTD
jgi:hypothetical protein